MTGTHIPHWLAPAGSCLSEQSGPGKGRFRAISLQGCNILAHSLGVTPLQVMALCLEHDVWPLRFARNRGVLSAEQQIRLLGARAAIIGCGGLGGHAAMLLARAGAGNITLCDGDVFSESNLNRQLFCRESNLGANKAEAVAGEISTIASHVEIEVYPRYLDADNAAEIVGGAHVILDCLDSIPTRLLVGNAAETGNIPLVYAAIAGDEGFVSVIRNGEKTLRKIYGSGKPSANQGAEAFLGVPSVTPAATAALQAAMAVHLLVGKEMPASSIMHLDLLVPMLERLEI